MHNIFVFCWKMHDITLLSGITIIQINENNANSVTFTHKKIDLPCQNKLSKSSYKMYLEHYLCIYTKKVFSQIMEKKTHTTNATQREDMVDDVFDQYAYALG